jgi:hypothetical protein
MFETKAVEKVKTLFSESRAMYEISGEKICYSRRGRYDNMIRRMRFACWVTKTTNTHSEYVILVGFPRQQWLGDGATV